MFQKMQVLKRFGKLHVMFIQYCPWLRLLFWRDRVPKKMQVLKRCGKLQVMLISVLPMECPSVPYLSLSRSLSLRVPTPCYLLS